MEIELGTTKEWAHRRERSARAGGLRALAALTLFLAIGAGCSDQPASDGRLGVVTTIGMIGDAASIIGGEHVRVESLMGPGVDPHMYKASAGDVRRLAEADLILYNGLHLEAAMGDVLSEMRESRKTVAVAEAIPPARLQAPAVQYPGAYDPHVWFDVSLWQLVADEVLKAIVEADPEHAADYRRNAAAYRAQLEELHAWVQSRTAELPVEQRVLVTAHDAFSYFGRAYGFEVRGLQGLNTATEAGTADMQQLAAFIAERRVPAVFVETSVPRRTIEAVQAAVRSRGFDVRIGDALFSDAMGDPGTPEGTYIGMVRHNVNTVVDALIAGATTTTSQR